MYNTIRIKSAIAMLDCGTKKGTAFLVNEDTAVTVSHCIIDALENDEEIILTFKNIEGMEMFTRKAFLFQNDIQQCPVSILKLEDKVETEYLKLGYSENLLKRDEKLFTYGYPAAKQEEGYPINVYVNDYLNENNPYDYDFSLLPDSKSKINDYSGMSGSPLLYGMKVVGILIAEGLVTENGSSTVIDINAISNETVQELYTKAGISLEKVYYQEQVEMTERYNEPKQLVLVENGMGSRNKNYDEKYVIDQSAVEELEELRGELEIVRKLKIEEIYKLKLEGNNDKAWNELNKLTNSIRGARNVDKRFLAKLYYIRALWYLEDKHDCQNAQKYLQKVLDNCPDYDCRTYYARKYFLEGNVLQEKEILFPIDNKFTLNTYIQICVQKNEVEDALQMYHKHLNLVNDGTQYLMALVYIQDHEYDIAEQFLDKAIKNCPKSPIYIMMKGIIQFWKAMSFQIPNENSILPAMYNVELLLDEEKKVSIGKAVGFYEQAYRLAEEAGNKELLLQILKVWLNTLSISKEFFEEAKQVCNKILEISPNQCHAIMYLYLIGEDISRYSIKDIEPCVKTAKMPIEPIMTCIYVAFGQKDKQQAYLLLKKYRYEYEHQNMLDQWFDLAIKSCPKEERKILSEQLEKSNIDSITKMRLHGIMLEVMGQEDKLLEHADKLYRQTNQELDLINLVHCCEKYQKWENVEKFSLEWKQNFSNSMAEISYIRSLAMQKRHRECLEMIQKIREDRRYECLTNEVRFLEAQAFKLIGELDEAISIAEELWEKTDNQNVLFLLAECHFLNGDEQETISILKHGIKKGLRTVALYQRLAEHEKLVVSRDAVKHVKKACFVSENDPEVLMWAMNFLYGIGESKEAGEIFVKLRTMEKVDFFRTASFKEVREILEEGNLESQRRYNMYKSSEVPYHVYIDTDDLASYTLLCTRCWDYNQKSGFQFPILANYGGHHIKDKKLETHYGKDVVMDFSTLLQIWHLGLWEEMLECWEHLYISGDINRMLMSEKRTCVPMQPDVLENNKERMNAWMQNELIYLPLPHKDELDFPEHSGMEYSDWVPYKIAKENELVWIEDHFIADLMEKPEVIPDEMRLGLVTPYELLTVLERRGDISTEFKERYPEKNQSIRENVIEKLIAYSGKIPILVDENFLREIYELDGINLITQKCKIHVWENIFTHIQNEQESLKYAREATALLDKLQDAICDAKEEGKIKFCERYQGEDINEREIHTGLLRDEIQFVAENQVAFICDDRMVTSYNKVGEAEIYNSLDILELLYDKATISQEKYLTVVTQLLKEGYSYIVPPYSYMKNVLYQTEDSDECMKELSTELKQVCSYLRMVTSPEKGLLNTVIRQGILPESVAFMYHLQREFLDLLLDVWKSSRTLQWKREISNWLVMNYSLFGYDFFYFNEISDEKLNYLALELAVFLFSGVYNNFDKSYYQWLFEWLEPCFNMQEWIEEKTIDSFANIMTDVYERTKNDPYCEIGIGALVQVATEEMPEYYAEKICSHSKISPLLGKFESSIVLLDRKNLIETSTFYEWIDEALKHGLNNPIQIKRGETEYEIAWVADDVFTQGFSISWTNGENHKVYYKIEGALLRCSDKILSSKGFYAITDYLDASQSKEYQTGKWQHEKIEAMLEEIKLNTEYRKHVIRKFIETSEYGIYDFENLLPENAEYFEHCSMSFADEDSRNKLEWCHEMLEKKKNPLIMLNILEIELANNGNDVEQVFTELISEQNVLWYNLYIEFIRYFFEQMNSKKSYSSYDEEKRIRWCYYYAGIALDIIWECEKDCKLKWSVEKLYSILKQHNSCFMHNFWDITENVSDPYRLSHVRLIVKPICKIVNRYEQQITKELVVGWLEGFDRRMLEDTDIIEEAVLFDSNIEDEIHHNMTGNLLDEMNALKVKYGILDEYIQTKETYQLYIREVKEKEEPSENAYCFLAILSKNPFQEEWMHDIESIVKYFPEQEASEVDYQKAMFVCLILRRLRKEFCDEYLPILKKWVIERLLVEAALHEKELFKIIEHISAIENPITPMESWISFWEEIISSEVDIHLSNKILEEMRRLTIIVSKEQAQRMRKIISKLNEV